VHVALVMPGHVGTSIVENSMRSHNQSGAQGAPMAAAQLEAARQRRRAAGMPDVSDAELRTLVQRRMASFRERAPITAAQAATIILAALIAGRWRILVGDDAHELDTLVREQPEGVYTAALTPRIHSLFPSLSMAGPSLPARKPEPEPAS
jgi:hypothetical protein